MPDVDILSKARVAFDIWSAHSPRHNFASLYFICGSCESCRETAIVFFSFQVIFWVSTISSAVRLRSGWCPGPSEAEDSIPACPIFVDDTVWIAHSLVPSSLHVLYFTSIVSWVGCPISECVFQAWYTSLSSPSACAFEIWCVKRSATRSPVLFLLVFIWSFLSGLLIWKLQVPLSFRTIDFRPWCDYSDKAHTLGCI